MDEYSTASYIRKVWNKQRSKNYKLKEVKKILKEEGYVAKSKKLMRYGTDLTLPINNVYNIHLEDTDPQYIQRNHHKYIQERRELNLQTFQGYIYQIRVSDSNNIQKSIALYLITDDGEKIIHSQNQEMNSYYSAFWINQFTQLNWFHSHGNAPHSLIGTHIELKVTINNNCAQIKFFSTLPWDEYSEEISKIHNFNDSMTKYA